MHKQVQGSKKKARYKKYLEREVKRKRQKIVEEEYREKMQNGTIEEMAKVMGIKLQ